MMTWGSTSPRGWGAPTPDSSTTHRAPGGGTVVLLARDPVQTDGLVLRVGAGP